MEDSNEPSPYEELPENHREAIDTAIDTLTDEFLADLADFLAVANGDFRDTAMSAFLPPQFAQRYTRLFAKQFFVAFVSAASKISGSSFSQLSCVAEELAAEAIIVEAEAVLELHGQEASFSLFRDQVFEDMDFAWLFRIEMDGIEDSEMAREMVMVNLRFEDWFKLFSEEHPELPPYLR